MMEYQERRLLVPLNLVDADDENVNEHDNLSIETIRASLEKFGQQKPIVVRVVGDRLKCVAGSGTRQAAELLQWREIWVTITDLAGLDVAAYAVADNQTARHSRLNDQRLAILLKRLHEQRFPTEYLGFKDNQVQKLIAQAEKGFADPHDRVIPFAEPSGEKKAALKREALPDGDNAAKAKPVIVTPSQRQVIEQAIELVRQIEEDPNITEGRALEFICADFFAGVSSPDPRS